MKASYRKTPTNTWEGVVKENGKIIWSCGHSHSCRDYNHSQYYAKLGSAMNCAKEELKRRIENEMSYDESEWFSWPI